MIFQPGSKIGNIGPVRKSFRPSAGFRAFEIESNSTLSGGSTINVLRYSSNITGVRITGSGTIETLVSYTSLFENGSGSPINSTWVYDNGKSVSLITAVSGVAQFYSKSGILIPSYFSSGTDVNRYSVSGLGSGDSWSFKAIVVIPDAMYVSSPAFETRVTEIV